MTVEDLLNPGAVAGDEHRAGREPLRVLERRHWSSFLRREEIAQAVGILTTSQACGVAVFGHWGVGKTTLARAVEAQLLPSRHIVRLFGARQAQPAPFAAFELYLARLPPADLVSAAASIAGIGALIHADAGTRPVLFIVDEIPEVDPASLAVLLHQILSGSAKVLVLARTPRHLPQDLAWLLTDGRLEQLRLEAFTHDEVGALIAQATGTAAAESAISLLHAGSHGKPMVFEAMFEELEANGRLQVSNGGGWVVSNPKTCRGGCANGGCARGSSANGGCEGAVGDALARIVELRLKGRSRLAREGVERMALLGRAPLDVLMAALGDERVHAMVEADLLDVGSDGADSIVLREPYIGEVIRRQLTAERKAQLLGEVDPSLNLETLMVQAGESRGIAGWLLDAGLELSTPTALAAAREANGRADPVLALRCAATVVPGDPLWPEAVSLAAAAHMELGEYRLAAEELEAGDSAAGETLDADGYAQWILARVSALVRMPGGSGEAVALLAKGRELLEGEPDSEGAAPVAGARTLRLGHCLVAVQHGEFAGVLAELSEGAKDDGDVGFALDCASLLVPALAATGRELEAVNLAHWTVRQAEVTGRPLSFRAYLRQGLLAALLWSGQWSEGKELLLGEFRAAAAPPFQRTARMQLELGMAQALSGSGAEAVETLSAACTQLTLNRRGEDLAVAHSALALAQALQGHEQESVLHLRLADTSPSPGSWMDRSMARILQWTARLWLADATAMGSMLLAARSDMSRRQFSTATNLLFASVLHGSDKDHAMLEQAALQCQGPLARLAVVLSRAMASGDSELALSGADLAKEMGAGAAETRLTALAVDFARENGDLVLARNAQRRFDTLKEQLLVVPVEPRTVGVDLTLRERQIAKLAKRGLGNREIAERIGVSVRTVEGHLYQAYNKLGVATRSQLERVVEL
ncbi:LuxR C-terminal-related transcriptional regulator [Arthrobacter sp. H35-D1]|uniref:helix-turn-helix transcriptional regulator n=1 Tax=Arthrobacter sp. H35-D1 TaxID=3046202 RepID=UPI0024BBCC5A|nr:LuxR C-terminal-related transcriptional regulator [Arthrobacter sp. H35-D1]MDJ0312347.1 LuxR C-terminal-related transcriptional regulator [Arthrobacter sp. H35-D1]